MSWWSDFWFPNGGVGSCSTNKSKNVNTNEKSKESKKIKESEDK